jgi:hypothetical protein
MVTFSYGVVLAPGQWSALFNGKQNALGYTPVNRAGDTMQGLLTTIASTSSSAGFSIPPGTPPDQPVDGNVWMTNGGLFARIGGATIGPITNGNVVGPPTSVVGDMPMFSTTDGTGIEDSGISLGSQPNNLILATPAFGSGSPAFRALVGADLPAPQAVALGGVKSAAAPPHEFGTGVDTSGNPTFGQPAIGDLSGLAANMLAFLAGGTSAQLAAAVPDGTGAGPLVFATGPAIQLGSTSTAVTQTPGDNSTRVATTAYVQAAIYATTTLPACKLATTAALPSVTYANGASGVGATLTATANGALTVDGVAASVNDVILVKNQASSFQNGIYTVTATGSAGAPFVLTRATWYNLTADIDLGDQTFVTGGATFGSTTWAQNATEHPVIGTDPITFAQTAGLGTYTAGNGLQLVGTQFSIDTTVTVDKTTAQALSNKSIGATSVTDAGLFALTGIISPAALAAGNTNDYAPANLATSSVLRLTPNAAGSVLTGLAASANAVLFLTNIGTANLTLLGNNTGSLAANRFLIPSPIILQPNQSINLWYDTASTGWRVEEVVAASPTGTSRKNLKIVTTSITAATITADELVLEDTFGNTYRATSVNVSYATGTGGANGLDTGTIAASTWYYEWVIYNATTNTVASLLSLSSTAPTMPAGYTFKARVGASYYDAGSKLRFKIQYDRRVQIVTGTNPTALPLMASGAAGTFSSTAPVYATVAVGAFVPPTAASIKVIAIANYNGAASGVNVLVAPNTSYGSYSTNPSDPPPVYIQGGVTSSYCAIDIVLESTNIAWVSGGAGGGLFAGGYEDNL